MPNQTSKSHKSQKTGEPAKPRQRNIAGVIAIPAEGSLPAASPSSGGEATTALVLPDSPANNPATMAELPREQQSWYRKPESKLRKQSEKIAVMRAAGHPVGEISKRLKTSDANVRFVEFIARKNGWYDEDGEPVDVEAELAFDIDRKIVRNISASLDGQMTNWQTHEMTIKAASGRGIFKSGDKQENLPQLQVVAIQVLMPPIGVVDQQIVDANVGGVPAYLEGEVQHELESGLFGGKAGEGHAVVVQPEHGRVSERDELGKAISE